MTENDPRRLGVADPADPSTALEAALFEIKRVIVGQEGMLERVLVALLSGGHLLLEGVPGLAKTRTIATLAQVLGGSFQRIQFTPDLVPSDLVGTRIWRPDQASFETELGPVFCNFLLADEINRAPAKVQSALLEVMQEHQVTIGKHSHRVPEPFLVLATQNPAELAGYIAYGASPRGSINLVAAARALAVLRGRSYALPQDVQELARDVLRHRLVLTYQAMAEQVTPDSLLTAVLAAIPPPRIDLAREQPA